MAVRLSLFLVIMLVAGCDREADIPSKPSQPPPEIDLSSFDHLRFECRFDSPISYEGSITAVGSQSGTHMEVTNPYWSWAHDPPMTKSGELTHEEATTLWTHLLRMKGRFQDVDVGATDTLRMHIIFDDGTRAHEMRLNISSPTDVPAAHAELLKIMEVAAKKIWYGE